MKRMALALCVSALFIGGPALAQASPNSNSGVIDGAGNGADIRSGVGPGGVDMNTGVKGSVIGRDTDADIDIKLNKKEFEKTDAEADTGTGIAGTDTGTDIGTNINTGTKTDANTITGSDANLTAKNMITSEDTALEADANMVGRSLIGARGETLGTVEAVRINTSGNREVLLRSTVNAKVVVLNRELISSGSTVGDLTAQTVSRADIEDMNAVSVSSAATGTVN